MKREAYNYEKSKYKIQPGETLENFFNEIA